MPIYMNCTRNNAQVVHGTVTEKGHIGWIELQSAQFGSTASVRAPGGVTGREASAPTITNIIVTKLQDDASTALLRESVSGAPMRVTLHFAHINDQGQVEVYLSVTLQEALISSYSVGGGGADNSTRPTEMLSFNFTKITYDHQGAGKDVSARVKSTMATTPP
jgi:type VI secretion system secreted protein Hcp